MGKRTRRERLVQSSPILFCVIAVVGLLSVACGELPESPAPLTPSTPPGTDATFAPAVGPAPAPKPVATLRASPSLKLGLYTVTLVNVDKHHQNDGWDRFDLSLNIFSPSRDDEKDLTVRRIKFPQADDYIANLLGEYGLYLVWGSNGKRAVRGGQCVFMVGGTSRMCMLEGRAPWGASHLDLVATKIDAVDIFAPRNVLGRLSLANIGEPPSPDAQGEGQSNFGTASMVTFGLTDSALDITATIGNKGDYADLQLDDIRLILYDERGNYLSDCKLFDFDGTLAPHASSVESAKVGVGPTVWPSVYYWAMVYDSERYLGGGKVAANH